MATPFQDEPDERSPALFQDEKSDHEGFSLGEEPDEPDDEPGGMKPVATSFHTSLFQDEVDEVDGLEGPVLLGAECGEPFDQIHCYKL